MSFSAFDLVQLERSFILKQEKPDKLGRDWLSVEDKALRIITNQLESAVKRAEAHRCLHALLRLQFLELKSPEIADLVDFKKFLPSLMEGFSYVSPVRDDATQVANVCKLALKSVQLLLTANISLEKVDVGCFLGTLRHLASFGLPGYRYQVPPAIRPSHLQKIDLDEIDVAADSVKSVSTTKRTKRSRGGKKKSSKAVANKELRNNLSETKQKKDPRFWSEQPNPWFSEKPDDESEVEITSWRSAKRWISGLESSSFAANGNPSLVSSDSEFSDLETTKPREAEARVRRESYEALKAAFKCLPRDTLTQFWWAFMPEAKLNVASGTTAEKPDGWTLTSALLQEPNCKCRFSAAVALDAYFRQCKIFLAVAEEQKGTMAFTPFAVQLGESLAEIHRQLRSAIKRETSPITMIQILNTLNTLTALTPFKRFPNGGLLGALVSDLKRFLTQSDRISQFGGGGSSLAIGVLTILGTMIRCHPNVKEVEDILASFGNRDSNGSSWIVLHCYDRVREAISAEEEGGKVRTIVAEAIQCLLVLNEVCKHYPKYLLGPDNCHWPVLENILVRGLAASQIQLHVAKFIPTVATVLMLGKNLTDGQPPAWEMLSPERQERFWLNLLSGPLPGLCQKLDLACLRAAACDCLAAISDTVLEALPSRMRLMCLSLLVGQAYDELPTARASAIRALGIYVLLPSLMEDESFVLDVCNAVKSGLNCESHAVRVNAAWALSNVTDALVAMSDRTPEDHGDLPNEFCVPLTTFLDLLREAMNGAEEKHNFKVRHSAVRSIGGLIKFIPKEWAADENVVELADAAFHRLIERALSDKDMKARWNACYAVSCALSNDRLSRDDVILPWSREVTVQLQPLIADFKNLKVRMRAAAAVLAVRDRAGFGPGFIPLWTALCRGLENIKNVSDFSEYQHVHGVVEQYCRALAHLTTLATLEDIQALCPLLSANCDVLEEHIYEAGSRLPPGNADFLLETARYLVNLRDDRERSLTPGQKEGLDLLVRIFGAEPFGPV